MRPGTTPGNEMAPTGFLPPRAAHIRKSLTPRNRKRNTGVSCWRHVCTKLLYLVTCVASMVLLVYVVPSTYLAVTSSSSAAVIHLRQRPTGRSDASSNAGVYPVPTGRDPSLFASGGATSASSSSFAATVSDEEQNRARTHASGDSWDGDALPALSSSSTSGANGGLASATSTESHEAARSARKKITTKRPMKPSRHQEPINSEIQETEPQQPDSLIPGPAISHSFTNSQSPPHQSGNPDIKAIDTSPVILTDFGALNRPFAPAASADSSPLDSTAAATASATADDAALPVITQNDSELKSSSANNNNNNGIALSSSTRSDEEHKNSVEDLVRGDDTKYSDAHPQADVIAPAPSVGSSVDTEQQMLAPSAFEQWQARSSQPAAIHPRRKVTISSDDADVVLITFANSVAPGLCDWLLSAVIAGWKQILVFGYEEPHVRRRIPQLQSGEFYMGKRQLAIRNYLLRKHGDEALAHSSILGVGGGAVSGDGPPAGGRQPSSAAMNKQVRGGATAEYSGPVYMFTDAFDVIIQSGPTSALEAYRSYKSDVVFAAEHDCWPYEFETLYPPPPENSKYRFINGGGYIGAPLALAKLLGATMEEAEKYRMHELTYDVRGEINGDGLAVSAEVGFVIDPGAIQTCSGVNVLTWDVVVPNCSAASLAAAEALRNPVQQMPNSEPAASPVTDTQLVPDASRDPDVMQPPELLRVPGFLRRNDQIILGMIYTSSSDSFGVTLDHRAKLFQTMQIPLETIAEHVFVCNSIVNVSQVTGVDLSGDDSVRCHVDGEIWNHKDTTTPPSIGDVSKPVAVHYNGPCKFAVEGGLSMAALVRNMRAHARDVFFTSTASAGAAGIGDAGGTLDGAAPELTAAQNAELSLAAERRAYELIRRHVRFVDHLGQDLPGVVDGMEQQCPDLLGNNRDFQEQQKPAEQEPAGAGP